MLNGTCHVKLKSSKFIPLTPEGFSLELNGFVLTEDIMHSIEMAYPGDGLPQHLRFYQNNAKITIENPSRITKSVCATDFLDPNASCSKKIGSCKRSIHFATEPLLIFWSKFPQWRNSIIMDFSRSSRICLSSLYINVSFLYSQKTFICNQHGFGHQIDSVRYCKLIINCLKQAHSIAKMYEDDYEKCQQSISSSFEYGFYTYHEGPIKQKTMREFL